MGAGHDHWPSPEEAAKAPDFRRKLGWAFAVVFSIVIVQAIGAWVTGSLALLVDMVHSLTDSMGLVVALVAAILMVRPASKKRTWGYRRIEVLAALLQALLLMGVSIYAIMEGIERWQNPPEVLGFELMIFAIISLSANVIAMFILASGRNANFNMKAAFLEVLMDALGTIAVIISAIVLMTTGYARADTLAAFVIAAMIIPRAALLIRETTRVLMEFTPKGLDLDEMREHMLDLDHVREVHDLHVSTVASGLVTLTAHVVVEDECFHDSHATETLKALKKCVAEHFNIHIHHSTFQIETEHIAEHEPEAVKHD